MTDLSYKIVSLHKASPKFFIVHFNHLKPYTPGTRFPTIVSSCTKCPTCTSSDYYVASLLITISLMLIHILMIRKETTPKRNMILFTWRNTDDSEEHNSEEGHDLEEHHMLGTHPLSHPTAPHYPSRARKLLIIFIHILLFKK